MFYVTALPPEWWCLKGDGDFVIEQITVKLDSGLNPVNIDILLAVGIMDMNLLDNQKHEKNESLSTVFEIAGAYSGGNYSFKATHPSLLENRGESADEEYHRECEKLARQNYSEAHRDFSQRHFEQACAVDKQLLWLASGAIGLPIAYLGQSSLMHISYLTQGESTTYSV